MDTGKQQKPRPAEKSDPHRHFCLTCRYVNGRVIEEPCKSCLTEEGYQKWEYRK